MVMLKQGVFSLGNFKIREFLVNNSVGSADGGCKRVDLHCKISAATRIKEATLVPYSSRICPGLY
jgi:hypothetical protein